MTAMDLAVDLSHYQEMNMTAMDLAVDLNHYKKSGEWDLIGELHVILLSLLHRLSTKTTFTDENLDLEMLGHYDLELIRNKCVRNCSLYTS